MIETEQAVRIKAPIQAVWAYAKDVERWAEIMPGYQECTIADDDNSHWVLKVGVGGLVRTVRVDVHVDRWAGPEAVDFSFKLKGDPVSGGGSYRAVSAGGETDVALQVKVNGEGPMAPMFAKGFAEQLRDRIEQIAGGATLEEVTARPPSLWARFLAWLTRLFGG
jgi:carbon monoxide dehydrogenase subunit G